MESPSSQPVIQPDQGANTRKTVIIIAAVAAGLCLICCVAGIVIFGVFGQRLSQGVASDPQEVAAKSAEIASFDVPSGFEPQSSIQLLGFTFITYASPSTNSAIILAQMPVQGEISEANIRQMQDQMERQFGQQLRNLKQVDQYDTTIRGEPGQVIIQEGTSEEGTAFRQMLVIFQGKGGLAMMSIFGPSASWDQAAYDQLVESIR